MYREKYLIVEDIGEGKHLKFAHDFFAANPVGSANLDLFDQKFFKAFICPALVTRLAPTVDHILQKTRGRAFLVIKGIITEELTNERMRERAQSTSGEAVE